MWLLDLKYREGSDRALRLGSCPSRANMCRMSEGTAVPGASITPARVVPLQTTHWPVTEEQQLGGIRHGIKSGRFHSKIQSRKQSSFAKSLLSETAFQCFGGFLASQYRIERGPQSALLGETRKPINPACWRPQAKWSESHSAVSDSLWPARTLEWVAVPFSRGFSQPRDWTQVSHIAGGFFTSLATRKAQRCQRIGENADKTETRASNRNNRGLGIPWQSSG